MKRMNKKGFTLIELLAVIIILGVLMIIAIPSVTTYIQNSRKSAYVDTAVAYADGVKTRVNEGKDFQLYSTETLYLIPVGDKTKADGGKSCVSVESGGQSPFSNTWDYAYVGVTFNGSNYSYFFVGQDGAGQGLAFMPYKVLTDEGTALIYSSTADKEYNQRGEDVQLHTKMTDAFRDQLKTSYEGANNLVSSTETGDGKIVIADDDMAELQAVVGTTKTKVEILGTCKSN